MNLSVKLIAILTGCLLSANALFAFNRQDSLRGSNGRGRNWWDVQRYELAITLDTGKKSIRGVNKITFLVTRPPSDSMQLDLQAPLKLSMVFLHGKQIPFVREGNVYWLPGMKKLLEERTEPFMLSLHYSGKPREAVKPPWDGGLIWTKDSLGNPWISVACQGLGASSWWPCKDDQRDEPDRGMKIELTNSANYSYDLGFISNGRMHDYRIDGEPTLENTYKTKDVATGAITQHVATGWEVKNQINTYNAALYLGDYTSWQDSYRGKYKPIQLHFSALRYHEARAKEHFKQVHKMLEAFEYWFGPYPFRDDGYKIVEAPFLGMEHQSAIAYGNRYQMGYQGKDRSGTGVGLLFDFIIVHESGHEWFGNSITAADIADNWIHEGFTTYSETLYAEYWFGKEKAFEYCRGEWKNITNDRNVIGTYGVNDAGSSDKYDKGSALVHAIRLLMNDDERFRAMLHKMNDTFYHKQISTRQMEDFIIGFSGLQLQPVFNQYLRSTMIPELQWRKQGKHLEYRFVHTVPGFTLPITLGLDHKEQKLRVTPEWQSIRLSSSSVQVSFPAEFLIQVKQLD